MDQLDADLRIRPIQFRQLAEDEQTETEVATLKSSQDNEQKRKHSQKASHTNAIVSSKQDPNNKNFQLSASNFSFEFSYPAVIINKVNFSLDGSQQHASSLLGPLVNGLGVLNCFEKSAKVHILKSIDLQVPYGSIFGLLGPSSCGKTTLLRCLVGLLQPSSGSIRLFGHESASSLQLNEQSKSLLGSCFSFGCDEDPCHVPGKNVGYMPQDLGLYDDFTIRKMLTLFGRFFGMEQSLIDRRIEFMASFLELPDVDREIYTLSGGQKRRVSFAIACIHNPPLIILDEPTVGVDPLLRQSIWRYLRQLARDENKTIIITTHYIEEAAQADQVALMRAGEILVQDTPTRIMQKCGCNTLEAAFLRICNDARQEPGDQPSPNINTNKPVIKVNRNLIEDCNPNNMKNYLSTQQPVLADLNRKLQLNETQRNHFANPSILSNPNSDLLDVDNIEYRSQSAGNDKGFSQNLFRKRKGFLPESQQELTGKRVKLKASITGQPKTSRRQRIVETVFLIFTIMYKNYQRNLNSLPLIAFQFMLPIVQMISFSLCVGGRPSNIGVGLVNNDRLSDQSLANATDQLLSLKFIEFVDKSVINIKPYERLDLALADVRQAKLWAAMEFSDNFTDSFQQRFDLDNFYQLGPETIRNSVIKLYPDRSNKILDMICIRVLVQSFREFLASQFEHFERLPIEVKEPIFKIEQNLISNSIDGYTESIAAGLLVSLTYIMAAGLTTFIMVVERSDGILERTYTSGIKPVIYLVAHATFRSVVMMVQIGVVMFLTFYLLKQPMEGSIVLAFLMLISINITGISYGLFVSSLVNDQNGAALAIVSSLVLKITMSGILWPIEAVPHFLTPICYALPLTLPIKALRNITLKGAGLNDRSVQLGFIVSTTWLLVFLTVSAKKFKFYKH